MKLSHYLIPLFICLLLTPRINAQIYVGLHGGVTLPQGFYADSRMSDNEWMLTEGHQFKAGAGKGWIGGIDISYAMPFLPDLEVTLSGEYMQSGVSRDIKDYYEIIYVQRYSQCQNYEMNLPLYRNIPILVGVRYSYPLGGIFNLYGEAMAGINFRSLTDWTTTFANSNWTLSDGQTFTDYNNIDIRRYNRATTFAFRLGAGILIKKKVSLEANFNMLGTSQLSWQQTQTSFQSLGSETIEHTSHTHVDYTDLNPTLVTVCLGYRLNVFKGGRHVQDW